MPLNTTEDQRRQQAAEDLADKILLESRVTRDLNELFREMGKDLTALYSTTNSIPEASNYDDDFTGILRAHYRRVSDRFSGSVTDFLKDLDEEDDEGLIIALTAIATSVGITVRDFIERIERQIRMETATFSSINVRRNVAFIRDTNQKELDNAVVVATAAVLASGVQQPTSAQIGNEAGKTFTIGQRSRASTIAATTTQNAAEGMKQIERDVFINQMRSSVVTPISELNEIWVTVGDENVRDSHVIADSQVKNEVGVFIVQGESLRFPGDTSLGATAGNVINCRCSAVPEISGTGNPIIEI